MPSFTVVDIFTFGAEVEAGVNDAPLFLDLDGDGLRTMRAINDWIVPEGNELTIRMDALVDPAKAARDARMTVKVFRADPKFEEPVPAEMLARFEWPIEEAGKTLPYRARIPFKVAEMPPTRLWKEAAPVEELEDGDRARMVEVAAALGAALRAGKLEEAYALLAYKYAEQERADGLADLKPEILSQYKVFVGQPGLKVDVVPPAEATFRMVAGGRLWQLGRGPTTDTIKITGDRISTKNRLYFARLGGDWKIAR